jgi:F-type H+-transporting ATPase subunit c
MRKKLMFLVVLVLLLAATPVFAQTPGTTSVVGSLTILGAIVGLGLAAGLCGIGQGKAVASAAEAVARNPGARAGIQTILILGLAFIESLTIFTLLIVFLKT